MKRAQTKLFKALQSVCVCIVTLTAVLLAQHPAFAASADANVLFILDGSGSMWGRVEGDTEKIVVAKERMTEMVQDWQNASMGLIVYGHRPKGDCGDIEMMVRG